MSADIAGSVRKAVFWRSGSQILSQAVAWGSTLAVVRILHPEDYGLFAMTQVILVFLNFLNGYAFASSLVRQRDLTPQLIRQGFGLLLLINAGLALLQLGLAPLAAAYYRQPIVADLLRLQALIYLATPFIALPEALMVRDLDFRRPAIANLVATLVMAGVSLGCALSGLGVWTLVWAPLSAFWTRGLVLVVLSRFFVLPSFRFRGAGEMLNFGLLLLGSHFFWTVQTQADVFIAGRRLDPHDLGLYAEALFLTMIVANKFVPPLNDVAFPAYSRLQDDPEAMAAAFRKVVRMILLATVPLYFGLAATAEDAVSVVFGAKWLEMAPLVTILSLAMPAFTLHILFAPAVNALGHARISMRASIFGAVVMIAAFLVGVRFGSVGLAWAWVAGFPLIPAFTYWQSRKLLGLSLSDLGGAVLPALGAGAGMAVIVRLVGSQLGALPDWVALIVQVGCGGIAYGAILWVFSRETLMELIALVVKRRPPVPAAA
ncbi:lipopolysaccharide biosynthesis protein [Novosphingobium sp. PC22D]|uniref:lipopolysaccharide biosynthesis protein n=1 Tax=Novosphingobium sp. PC22D TaxID=1962403 RepID=UPI000BEF8514|nr:lipopolysaccharide biosynthesis protein [Novosphingobium sp. PC22D]PEQ11343.1 lipopolysaccharide biosynthesis protein [Novosphingobium sp. PC22D]